MVSERKIQMAEEIKKLLKDYRSFGVFDLFKLTTREFQIIKRRLNDLKFKVVKKKIFIKILEELGKKEIEKYLPNQIGLFFSNETNPFNLFRKIERCIVYRFALPGDTAPSDIIVPPGPTKLKPGPVISEFARAKIPARVEKGVITVVKEVTAAKKGDVITKELASILRKLEIKPIPVKLKVSVICCDGDIYPRNVLELVFEYPNLLKRCIQYAFNLSININYPTKETIRYLIMKAYYHANALNRVMK